ncbi:MAG: Ig-like domain-containing protein [Oscillospiraceae bacterium]|nr:Ig-like domain-containing protein [Oscillospiraceae bacterium]
MKHSVWNKTLCLLLALVMLLGMIPAGAAAAEAEASPETITIDFKQFARDASAEDWWDALGATDEDTRFIGKKDNNNPMTAAQKQAYADMRAYLAENEVWNIDETLSGFEGDLKRAYFNTDADMPWGLNFYTYYHANGAVPDKGKFAMTVTAPAAGWYRLEMDAFRSSEYYNQAQSICHNQGGGGGHVNIYVNDALIHEDYSFSTRDYSNTARYYGSVDNLGAVYLEEGENSVILDSIYAFNGPTVTTSGRCNITLNAMTFEPLAGLTVMEENAYSYDLTTSWLAFTDDTAALTAESSDEALFRASFEDGQLVIEAVCAGEGEVTVLDGSEALFAIPVTVEALVNEAKTPIVIDFKAFAREASAQDWWDDLGATDANTRYIGRINNNDTVSAERRDAYQAMRDHLAENESWTIDESICEFNSNWKRAFFNADPNVPWGISYWCYYHGNSTVPERAKLAFTVTAQESGWYSMELDAFRSNTGYSTESMTIGGSGGGHVDVYVNGQKVYNDYSFSARDYANTATHYGAVNNIGKVWLNEGENSVYLNSIHAFDGASTVVSGRCNINLNSITFEPLNVQTLKVGSTRVLDLRASYLGYQDEFLGEAVSSDTDVVGAELDGTLLTMTAVQTGEAQIAVGDIIIPVVVEEYCGESYDLTDTVLSGDSASGEIAIEVSEDGWYEPVLRFIRSSSGGKVSVYVDDRYLGTVNTYDSDDKIAAFDRLGEVELTAGEHTLRLAVTGKDNGMGGNTAKVQCLGLELLPTEEPTIRLSAKGITEKRLRPAETKLIVSGMANSAVDAVWDLEVSDETVLEAQIVPATLSSEAKLEVMGLQASDDAWVTVTANVGGVIDAVTVPVTVLPTAKLVSMDAEVVGNVSGLLPRATFQKFGFDMMGDDGAAMTPEEVEISYAVSEAGIIEIDADTHTFETLANGEVTVTITAQQDDTVFTDSLVITVDDMGENELAPAISSFDDASKWDGLIAPSDSQWLSSQIVDDGTGNMALKLEHDPNVTQNQSKSPAYVPKNGNMATMELGHLYEMHFRFKYEGYKRAEGAKYDPRISVQIYDYYGNGFGVGGNVNKLYTGIILPFFNYEEGQWHDMVVYARGPADGEGSVFGMPRITYNCHYASPADKDLTGWEGTFWFDDIEVREVGFETMEVVADGELRADKMKATVTARPVSTTGNYLTLDKGTLRNNITFESGNADVITVISEPAVIEDKPAGFELTREAATAKVQLVGKNDTGSVLATATVGKATRTGALEITATNMPEVIRDITVTLNGVESLVLPHGGTAESAVTGRTTELTPLAWEDFDSIYFSSSDLTVATVEPYTGKVTCVGEGTAVITAYALLGDKTVKDTALITVTDDTDLASIEIDASSVQVAEGNLLHFSVAGQKSSGVKADMAKYPVAWSTSDETVATITSEGILTAVKAGTVTVKATIGVEDAVIEDTMLITVAANEDAPGKVVEFKFYNEGAPKLETASLEKDGIEIDRERTYKGLEGNEWHKGGFKFPVPVGGELVIDFMIKRSGWYRVEPRGYSLYYVGCLTSFYVDDTYIGSPDFGADAASNYEAGGVYNTIWLEAGKHTMRYKAEEARSITAGQVRFWPVDDPNEVRFTASAAKDTLVAGEQTTLELDMRDANQAEWFLHYETAKPDYTNYYMAVSSDPSVVSITRDLFTTYLNAHKAGEVTITVTAEILGETVVQEIPVVVENGIIVSAELDADFTTHRPGDDPFPLTIKATSLEGELSALPEGTTVTYTSADPQIAAVSADGTVTPGTKEGSTLITAVVDESGHKISLEIWITITSGKSEPTIFTYEERANAQENVLKYNWAWQEKEAAVKLADYYVENIDALYEAFMHEGIPKNSRLTLLGDTDYAICPGCGTDLVAAGYGTAYHYLVDPIENPWKVTCPHCKMDFPSNDFESFYKLGLDERGRFTIDRAMANGGEKYLVNELYPERGEKWGVDNGWGWFPGEYAVDGNERAYLFIGYYVTFNLYTVSGSSGPHGATSVLDALREAYIFTGDEKYGNAGAILIDRYADIYPGHDLSHWSKHRTWYSGNAGNFGKVTDLIWESILIQCLAKAVDAFWPCADNTEVVEYLRGKASLKGLEPEDITPDQIRQNAENGILREAIKSYYSGKAWGNFGIPQAGAALTAVCLDSNPETEDLINWIFKASDKGGTTENGWNTGGDVNRVLVEEVCRDGFGNEGSMSYNYIWLTNLLDCADALNGYDKVESANLWEHPKFLNMYRAYMKVTCCGRLCHDLHETPGAFQALPALVQPEVLMPAFIATGDPEIAQAIYSRNGNSVDGLHADIYTKDPESGLRTRIQKTVDEYGQWDMSRSDLLKGYGMSILRRGPETYVAGANEEQFFDFWMGYGKTDSHTHFEAMNMELSAFGLPLNGNMGYPQVMSGDSYNRLQWIQNTVSNNTVVVDDSCQVSNSESGFPLHFEDAGKVKIMDADAPASYAQTDIYRRTVVTVQGDNGVDYVWTSSVSWAAPSMSIPSMARPGSIPPPRALTWSISPWALMRAPMCPSVTTSTTRKRAPRSIPAPATTGCGMSTAMRPPAPSSLWTGRSRTTSISWSPPMVSI